jgi:C-methyltransferase C-terminal domain/Putative zinc binding domain/Methyltransferase domain
MRMCERAGSITSTCRGCGARNLTVVLDLGEVPPADHFPLVDSPLTDTETMHRLAMVFCDECRLAQLAEDVTQAEEPRGMEPQALREQAVDAVSRVAAAGLLNGRSVREYSSPHGGSWIPLLERRGFRPASALADVIIDSFGIMHESNQRDAFRCRAQNLSTDGVLLLQFHSLATIVRNGQWNALRHGHFAYYSLTSLNKLLSAAGLGIRSAWEFDLYGGTVMVAAGHNPVQPDESVRRLLEDERALGITSAGGLGGLQDQADNHASTLRRWLAEEAEAGRTVLAYGAASRAVALFSRAGLNSKLLAAVGDASGAKQGRRMPGTDIPIVSPEELEAARPDRVLLTIPDLLPEVSARFPQWDGCWKVEG